MKEQNYLVLFCLLSLGIMKSYGQTITTTTLYATEDAYTKSGAANTNTNYGSLTELIVTSSTYTTTPLTYSATRSFVKFDLTSIPTDAVITSAKLRLRPKSESLAVSGSTDLQADLANTTWGQSTITHTSGISKNTNISTVTLSNLVSVTDFQGTVDYREFDVKSHVQALVEARIPNHGWRIVRNPETGNLTPAIYYSIEHLNNSYFIPHLEVKYYIPMTVTSATIVQTTTTSSADGSISPVIAGGSSASKTYQWYTSSGSAISGATSLNLTGRTYGWYGLRVTGTDPSDVMYYAFVIGVKCATVSVTFAPDGNYVDDTYLINNVTGSGTTADFNTQLNNATAGVIPASENISPMTTEGLFRFRLWFDPNLTVNSANLTLYGNAHAPTDRPNTSYLKLVNAPWAESSVAYTNRPVSLTSPSVTINSIAAGNGNATVDIVSLVNSWKLNNPQNYGCHFQLTFYEGSVTKMQFNSSEAAVGVRPSLALSLTSADCGTNTNLYYVPEENVGPEVADLRNSNKTLRIRYKDYFDSDGSLNYSIKCLTDDSSVTPPVISKDANTNWILINLNSSGLVMGNIYLLELKDASGKKEYLKFKVVNS